MANDIELTQNNDLAYDLRQRYAKLVGDHLEMISVLRVRKNYPEYFNALDHLYTIVEFKFKERTKNTIKTEDLKQLIEEYENLRKKVCELANEHVGVYFGKSRDPDGVAAIEFALKSIERYLLFKMDEANMFGSKREVEGLI